MYLVSVEKILEQKEAFYEKYKPGTLHEDYKHTPEEMESLRKKLYFLINVQNGLDIDDATMHDKVSLYKDSHDIIKDKDLLILGTGTGREVIFAKSLGAKRVEGTTLGLRNVKFAEEVLEEKLTLCDMHMLPYSDAEFDVIAAYQVLEHSCMPVVALLEWHRVLREGGKVLVETPPSKTHTFDTWLHHIICPTPRQLYYLFIKTGFKPVKFNSIDISNVDFKDPDFVGVDDPSINIYMEAVKENPYSYARGDMRRYYEILKDKDFVF